MQSCDFKGSTIDPALARTRPRGLGLYRGRSGKAHKQQKTQHCSGLTYQARAQSSHQPSHSPHTCSSTLQAISMPPAKELTDAVVTETGDKLLRGSVRPDGTVRKDRRIRAGYTPQDEQPTYQPRAALVRSMPDTARHMYVCRLREDVLIWRP